MALRRRSALSLRRADAAKYASSVPPFNGFRTGLLIPGIALPENSNANIYFCSEAFVDTLGLRMVDAFGAAYAHLPWAAIYASPRLRARQTADALAKRIGAGKKH